jgi:hypothetical protein
MSIPVLKDLADPTGGLPPAAQWSSLRTGDIDGDGKTDVLALDGSGLQAWTYDPGAKAWRKFAPSTPLALNGDLWNQQPEEYGTIQVGDVDGDGRDDVVARGPFGIWASCAGPGRGRSTRSASGAPRTRASPPGRTRRSCRRSTSAITSRTARTASTTATASARRRLGWASSAGAWTSR